MCAVLRLSWSRQARNTLLLIVCAALSCFPALGASPQLSRLFPAGAQRGATTTVDCHGEFSWPVKVSAPGVDVQVGEQKGRLTISVPSDLAADRVWIRLYNNEGASEALPFLIGSLRETREVEPNDSPLTAQRLAAEVPPPGDSEVTINGILQQDGDVDGFAIALSAGQTLVAAVAANAALGSPMDSILQIVTADGTVLAEKHDDVGLDPRLAFTAATSDIVVVRLFAFPSKPDQRIRFRGGEDYIYRLTLTTGPYITHSVPMSVYQTEARRTEPDTVEVFGWNIPRGTRLPVVPLGPSTPDQRSEVEGIGSGPVTPAQLGFVWAPRWAGSARVRQVSHRVQPAMAVTTQSQPLELAPPNAVSGCICTPRQSDYFRLPLQKDQPVRIAMEAVSLDSPLVPRVRLADPAGKTVAEAPTKGPENDVSLTHKPTVAGDYLLTIRDRYLHGGPRYFYRLTVRRQRADFELSLATDALVLTPEKPLEVPVTIKRHAAPGEALGEVTIAAVGLPAGVSAPAVVSAAQGDTAGKVTLKLETTGPPFSGWIQIRGTSAEHQIQRDALTPAKFRARFDRIWLTVTDSSP